jgi:ABC-type nitrate/sulfonate/bicarbonate transport system ATPase subunit
MNYSYKENGTILHVTDLSVVYDGKTIISNINFEEKDITRSDKTQGQCIAFVGRSGRGKSTLFRMLTGLEKPATGMVLIPDFSKSIEDGKQPAKIVQEGDVGFVDQKYTLFRHKTVCQALNFALRFVKITADEKKRIIADSLREWGLDKVKDQFPHQLSGGQRQRTAILEQLLNSGNYIVLDEPFSGLDIGNINSVKKAFQLISDRNELNTIIFSTHDIKLAVELADSIYVIGYSPDNSGNLSGIGTILKHFDLKKMGLAWETEFSKSHYELVNEIEAIMLKS